MPATSLPSRIGRYDVVGRLATGGMAEVFLARLRGPHGFERPIVIKRILPHLALDGAIVDMFLDEARIIANLRHPNLVAIHELGNDAGELFMAMEYLEGESVASICRRLAARGEYLDPAVAAHVVAEACAGLQAAHDATSADGRPLAIVHRDVSPQNIFVTYAGSVHVIDFGIAITADRVSRTEAGTVRGKCEYLAPEQLRGLPIDRRADVFGLGVVLFELVSGRRLYRRPSHAEAFMAILGEPVPSLRALRRDAPERLQAICERALSKERDERHQTATELRRELLAFARSRADDPGELLGGLMRNLFADRVEEKATMLQHVRSGGSIPALPAAEVDVAVELPTATADATTLLSQSIPLHPGDPPGRPSLARRWLLPPLGLAALLGMGALAWRGAEPSAPSAAVAASPAPPPSVPSPAATAPQSQGAAGPVAPQPATAASAAPVDSQPPRAAPRPARRSGHAAPASTNAPTLW